MFDYSSLKIGVKVLNNKGLQCQRSYFQYCLIFSDIPYFIRNYMFSMCNPFIVVIKFVIVMPHVFLGVSIQISFSSFVIFYGSCVTTSFSLTKFVIDS